MRSKRAYGVHSVRAPAPTRAVDSARPASSHVPAAACLNSLQFAELIAAAARLTPVHSRSISRSLPDVVDPTRRPSSSYQR